MSNANLAPDLQGYKRILKVLKTIENPSPEDQKTIKKLKDYIKQENERVKNRQIEKYEILVFNDNSCPAIVTGGELMGEARDKMQRVVENMGNRNNVVLFRIYNDGSKKELDEWDCKKQKLRKGR